MKLNIQPRVRKSPIHQKRLVSTNIKQARKLSGQGLTTPPPIYPKPSVMAVMDMKFGSQPKQVLNLEDALPKLRATLAP
jgi:hypothetical protein